MANNADCNDANININPGETEVCNGLDDNCASGVDDGNVCSITNYYCDNDTDTYISSLPAGSCNIFNCTPISCTNNLGNDCNDTMQTINPAASEICDGRDNNCDGSIDNGAMNTYYYDNDGDGFGNALITSQACTAPSGYVANNNDCNDNDANIKPTGTEMCDNKDNNCDGATDEGVQLTFYRDADTDGYGNLTQTIMNCSAPVGYIAGSTDCNDGNNLINPAAQDLLCDGIDNDCDGTSDEGYLSTPTSCGVGACAGGAGELICVSGALSDTCQANWNSSPESCSDNTGYDGLDNNCDNTIDLECSAYCDQDNDGYSPNVICRIAGYGITDCDDTNSAINPAANESCDGIDNDCDQDTLDGSTEIWFNQQTSCGTGGCSSTGALICNQSSIVNTCNAGVSAIEICDSMDNDCNGQIDEGVINIYYADADNDGYGDITNTNLSCSAPSGFVDNSNDCNDQNLDIYPGANESCDGIDNDCNTMTIDGLSEIWNNQQTSCGIGACQNTGALVCQEGEQTNNCVQLNATAEICDALDNNCDGIVDEGCSCELTDGTWSQQIVEENTNVNLTVAGISCDDGEQVSLAIYREDNSQSVGTYLIAMQNNNSYLEWKTVLDPILNASLQRYYFTARLANQSYVQINSTPPNLIVLPYQPVVYYGDGSYDLKEGDSVIINKTVLVNNALHSAGIIYRVLEYDEGALKLSIERYNERFEYLLNDSLIAFGTNVTLNNFDLTTANIRFYSIEPRSNVGNTALQESEVIVGKNTTLSLPVSFDLSTGITDLKLELPSLGITALSYSIEEDGKSVSSLTNQNNITWTANLSASNVFLKVKVASPQIFNETPEIKTDQNYKNFINISSKYHFVNVTYLTASPGNYNSYTLSWYNGTNWTDSTAKYNFKIESGSMIFSGFSTSDQLFIIEGVCNNCNPSDDGGGDSGGSGGSGGGYRPPRTQQQEVAGGSIPTQDNDTGEEEPVVEEPGLLNVSIDQQREPETKIRVTSIISIAALAIALIIFLVSGAIVIRKRYQDPHYRYIKTLSDYVARQRKFGFDDETIRSVVTKAGWPQDYIDKALEKNKIQVSLTEKSDQQT